MDVALCIFLIYCLYIQGRGSRRGEWLGIAVDGRLADDGKRIQCDGRFDLMRKPSYRVGVWGRENAKIFSGSRLADDGKRM